MCPRRSAKGRVWQSGDEGCEPEGRSPHLPACLAVYSPEGEQRLSASKHSPGFKQPSLEGSYGWGERTRTLPLTHGQDVNTVPSWFRQDPCLCILILCILWAIWIVSQNSCFLRQPGAARYPAPCRGPAAIAGAAHWKPIYFTQQRVCFFCFVLFCFQEAGQKVLGF